MSIDRNVTILLSVVSISIILIFWASAWLKAKKIQAKQDERADTLKGLSLLILKLHESQVAIVILIVLCVIIASAVVSFFRAELGPEWSRCIILGFLAMIFFLIGLAAYIAYKRHNRR